MEIQLKELIDTIKEEGFKSAQLDGQEIVEKAKEEAALIVSNAKQEASLLLQEAKAQIAKDQSSSNAAILQASRDVILNLKKQIESLLDTVIQTQVSSNFSGDTLKEAIVAVVKGIASDVNDLTLLVNEKQLSNIESSLRSALNEEFKKGLELRPIDSINCGFRVSLKNGTAFYDFSDKEITSVLSGFLNKKLAHIITSQI